MTAPSNVPNYPAAAPPAAVLAWGGLVHIADAPTGALYAGSAFGIQQANVLANVELPQAVYVLAAARTVLSSFAWWVDGFAATGQQATFALAVDGSTIRTLRTVCGAGNAKQGSAVFTPVLLNAGQRVGIVYVGDAGDVDALATAFFVM